MNEEMFTGDQVQETPLEETVYQFKVEPKEPTVSNLEQQQNAKLIQEAVLAQRKQVETNAARSQAEGIQTAILEDFDVCKSLEARLSDGRIIKMAEPPTAQQFVIDGWFDAQAYSAKQIALAIMHIVELGGEPVSMPKSKAEMIAIADRLKSRGVSDVQMLYSKHFAGIVNLQVLKKNL